MSQKKIPSKEVLIEALKELDGNMAACARRFHCSRGTVWSVVNSDLELRELVDELSSSFTDEAEQTLFKAIRDGNIIATIFYLKTRGRDRGYSERLELVPLSTQSIEIELGCPTSNAIEDSQTQALNGHGAAVALLEQ
jgi:hypothetical protein